MAVSTSSAIRTQFFDYLFGQTNGYLCICTGNPDVERKSPEFFKQHFFSWPEQRGDVASFIDQATHRRNVWYCTSLLEKPERKKEYCLPGSLVWADLDTCNPNKVDPVPSVIVESSPRRWQALWRTSTVLEPYEQEDYSRRIAYKYSNSGADVTGWDLTQLLRVPETYNFKYMDGDDIPMVKLIQSLETPVPSNLFLDIDAAPSDNLTTVDAADSLPDVSKLPDSEMILYKYFAAVSTNQFKQLYLVEPNEDQDWSTALWRLLNISIEAGMSDEEVFVVALTSACNKYKRDNRPVVHLWEDVLRASEQQRRVNLIIGGISPFEMPTLIEDSPISSSISFVEEYRAWASEATDAVTEFHELAAFIMLSAVCAAGIRLYTNYAPQGMVPNLWGLILGDSTLTRKTTAMRLMSDMLIEIDPDLVLATDGSAEGLLTGLAGRPNRTSMFLKDEVSGFFDSINRKDYLAGMPEILTHLYDVPKVYTRLLRKETITISSPVFIFFGGGIRDKVYSLVDDGYILSGFLPRFLIVSGDADLDKIRRTGPANINVTDKRDAILRRVSNLYETYTETATMNLLGQEISIPATHTAELTEDAWKRYGDIEMKMVHAANDSPLSNMALPTFERLSRSMLKMAVILGASNGKPTEERKIIVDEGDVINAAHYIQRWGRYTIDLINNAGKGSSERTLAKILNTIIKTPGIRKSDVMNRHHLTSREVNEILTTLQDRGQIDVSKQGRGYVIKAVT